jgi:hypothetical protein
MDLIGLRLAGCLAALTLLLPAVAASAAGSTSGAGVRHARAHSASHARGHSARRAHKAAKRHGSAHRAGQAGGERNVEGSLSYELSPAGNGLPATQTITLFLPGGVKAAGQSMPKCEPTALEREGPSVCPKHSLLGSGSATGWTLGQLWPLSLTLYNGPGGNLLSYVTASSPVKIETIVQGTVSKPGGPYGEEIVNTLPAELLEPLPGDVAQTVNLHVHLNGNSGWLRSTNCAPHALAVNFSFNYTNGQTISVGGNLRCL